MKKLLISVAAIPLTTFLLAAQDSTAGAQSWSGLLVAAACQADGTNANAHMNRSTPTGSDLPRSTTAPNREQNSTYEQTQNQAGRPRTDSSTERDRMARTTDRGSSVTPKSDDTLSRVTTPPVDDQGTRGKATINNTASNDASKRAEGANEADRTAAKRTTGSSDSDLAKNLDSSCRVGQNTTAFALRLADGSLVKFDDASNAKIAQQLQSGDRLQHKTKIFRINVKGSMQSGAISADTIQL